MTRNRRPSRGGSRRGARHGSGGITKSRVFIVLGAIAVVGAIAYAVWIGGEKTERIANIDPVTQCPKDGPVAGISVLVDRTDGLNAIQAEQVVRLIGRAADAVPSGGIFKVYEVGKGKELLTPIVSACNPGDGSNENYITGNPAQAKAKYEATYVEPIRKMAEGMRADAEADSSPIMEAIQAVAIQDFGDDNKKMTKRELYLVSDLMQHIPSTFSLYKGIPGVKEFASTPYAASVHVDLSKVVVHLYSVTRPKMDEKFLSKLRQFWVGWMEYQNAIRIIDGRISG